MASGPWGKQKCEDNGPLTKKLRLGSFLGYVKGGGAWERDDYWGDDDHPRDRVYRAGDAVGMDDRCRR